MNQKPLFKNRRGDSRRLLRCRASVSFASGPAMEAQILDVSLSGLGLVLSSNLPVGMDLRVRFGLQHKTLGSVQIDASARVVHSVFSAATGAFKTGLIFTRLADAQRAAIESYLHD